LLAMHRELVAVQLDELKKYAQFFRKCTLADESATWQRFGLLGADSALQALDLPLPEADNAVTAQEGILLIRLDKTRSELWLRAEIAAQWQASLAAHLPQSSLNGWLLAQIRAGIGQVFATTSARFIPQMLNLQAVGAVSFKKGCYTGQEIVARMQYRGQSKRRLYRLHAPALLSPPAAGTPLAESAGEVVLAAQAENGCELLAVLTDSAAEQNNLRLEDGSALELLELPYTLNRDLEIQR